MSDVWSTMAGECGQGDGLHLTTGDHALLEVIDPETAEPLPLDDGVTGELVWTHLNRKASPLLRYRSSDLATVWTAPCACGRTTPRIRIGGRRDDMLRVQAVNVYPQAIGELLGGARHAVVADGDPIVPPLHVYVEGRPTRSASRPSCAPMSRSTSSHLAACRSPSTRRRKSSEPPGATNCRTRSDTTEESDERHRRRARHRPDHQLGQPAPPQRVGPRDDRRDRRRARRRRPRARRALPRRPRRRARTSPPATTCSRPPSPTSTASPPPSTSSSASPRSCSSRSSP